MISTWQSVAVALSVAVEKAGTTTKTAMTNGVARMAMMESGIAGIALTATIQMMNRCKGALTMSAVQITRIAMIGGV